MKEKFILIILLTNWGIINSQSVSSLETDISQIVKNYVPYFEAVKISSKGEFVIFEKINDFSSTEILFNLQEIEILGIEKSSQEGYGRPIGVYRILLLCRTGECVSGKRFKIENEKKFFDKQWKNNQIWFYFDDYNQAEILERKLNQVKRISG